MRNPVRSCLSKHPRRGYRQQPPRLRRIKKARERRGYWRGRVLWWLCGGHARLHALTELVERSEAKLIAVGDGKQLPSIGPGGMFDRLTGHAPTAELADIHRTSDAGEQKAWRALRAGEPERAMAHYHSLGRLHLADTRDQAAENAVQAWGQLTSEHDDIRSVALIADASNQGD
jgi:hypothetical protein